MFTAETAEIAENLIRVFIRESTLPWLYDRLSPQQV
jgi:hypothetical protein